MSFFRILLFVCFERKNCWWFPNIFPCNSCSSPNSAFSRIWALVLAVASFSCILSHCVSFSTCWRFSKNFLCKQFCKFYFTFYPAWFGASWTVQFWTSSWRSNEWPFVFDGAFEHLSSSFVSFNQECIFFLKLKTLSSTSSTHSSLLLICSSSRVCLHSSCATNFRMSLNCANFSSTATLLRLEQSRSSMASLFLKSLGYSLCLLSLIWDNLYTLTFYDGFFTLCPLPKLLWFSWNSLFYLKRSNSC